MRTYLTAVAVAVGAAFVLAACGGGSSTTTVTATSASNAGLSTRSYKNLEAVEKMAHTENNKAVSQFGYCTTLVSQNQSKSLIDSCFLSSTGNILLLGGEVSGFLQALMQESTGACHAALSQTNDHVAAYITAVQTLDATAKAGKVPSTSDINTAKSALGTLQTSKGAVKAACFPS
jgi:hypothetical protein